eukprot:343178-Ditylum_brightwellii.AAC.1
MQWVKGHQDVKKSARELKWEEKLYIRAELLATKTRYEITAPKRYKSFDCLPACLAHIEINGKPITSEIITLIRDAWCKIDFRKHQRAKFG